jgi:hypothetical protein
MEAVSPPINQRPSRAIVVRILYGMQQISGQNTVVSLQNMCIRSDRGLLESEKVMTMLYLLTSSTAPLVVSRVMKL